MAFTVSQPGTKFPSILPELDISEICKLLYSKYLDRGAIFSVHEPISCQPTMPESMTLTGVEMAVIINK